MDGVQVKTRFFVEFRRVDANHAIRARPEGEADLAVDRRWQDETVVVVGMLTDKIHPSGRPENARWRRPEAGLNPRVRGRNSHSSFGA